MNALEEEYAVEFECNVNYTLYVRDWHSTKGGCGTVVCKV